MAAFLCDFKHDNIDTLYDTPVVPIEELPAVCTCGQPLTYADAVTFVLHTEDGSPFVRTVVHTLASERGADGNTNLADPT